MSSCIYNYHYHLRMTPVLMMVKMSLMPHLVYRPLH